MQEDLQNKSVVLTTKAAKLTGRGLAALMRAALRKMRQARDAPKEGRQTVKQLSRGGSLQNIEISDDNIKAFEPFARKFGVSYAKTRQTYVDYCKAGYSKTFRATHEADIILHQTAKKVFDTLKGTGELGIKKLPTVASLRAEYAPMLEEKKRAYTEFRAARDEKRELLTAKSNVDRLLNITDERPAREPEREER